MSTNPFQDHHFIAHRLELLAAQRFLPSLRGRVLDVGCGYQPLKKILRDCEYVGMDMDASRNPDLVGSVLDIPQNDGSFDAVIFTQVIEHVPDPNKALSEILRCLRPGGILYVTAPQSWGLHYEPHDYFRFTRYGLDLILKANGFEVNEMEKIGGIASLTSSTLMSFIGDKILLPLNTSILRMFGIKRGEYRATALILGPFNLIFYLFSIVIDKFDDANVLGWVAIAKKN